MSETVLSYLKKQKSQYPRNVLVETDYQIIFFGIFFCMCVVWYDKSLD